MNSTTNQLQSVELFLVCSSWQEAQRIVDHLLERQLINCAEYLHAKPRFNWKDNDEINLIMESAHHYIDAVKAEITLLHPHKSYDLQMLPIASPPSVSQHIAGVR